MSVNAIRVEDLGKRYRIGGPREEYKTLRDALAGVARAPLGWFGRRVQDEESRDSVWALKDVSFEVEEGKAVGVIGRNGAGKSTLLKILSRVTDPTTGRVLVRGRVGSLLEVGTGFHAELTGRENIYMNGAILGMKRSDIRRRFDEIVAFAEVDRFLDTPVKRYSSGMYLRLAFAVAAHLDPEVLVVDEVLAVGDYGFQKKCLGKMGDSTRDGKTVLLVSHNMPSILNLCSSAVLLDEGRIAAAGGANDVVRAYMDSMSVDAGEVTWPEIMKAPGGSTVRLHAVRTLDSAGQVTADIDISEDFDIEIAYWNLVNGSRLNCTIQVLDRVGTMVFSSINMTSASVSPDPWFDRPMPTGLYSTKCRVPGELLNEGRYTVNVYIQKNITLRQAEKEHALSFTIHDSGAMRQEYAGGWGGVVRPRLHWETEHVEELPPQVSSAESDGGKWDSG